MILKEMGFLRIVLLLTTVFFNSVVPVAGTHESYEGVDAFFNTVIPSLTPLVFMVLLLDALMSRVMIDGKNDSGKIVSRRNSYISLALAFSLIIFWASFYLDLLGL
ncbi:hypothetical protein MNBD_GAMMA22-2675 [hydrothermal vent metagenome]|uniref:Uncharacterized protein n=1 Tax=hydrothermal vent metagenome TaxID=652676 RepID=A0A3B0ZCU3_9ZZZZ